MDNLEKIFFEFVYERQLIWYKRFILKEHPPWTIDEIMLKYKIINVYRELDKCTVYIVNKLKSVKDRDKLLLNLVFYRFFNQDNLYESLDIKPFDKIDKNLYDGLISSFENIKKQGRPIFNNAYLISSGEKGQKKHISILTNLQRVDIKTLINEIDKCKSPRESLEVIQKIPMVGPFLACEIWTDLTYFKFFKQKWTDNDFVNLGPGAKWGLEIMYGKMTKDKLNDKLRHLHNIQKDFLKEDWKKIAYANAYSNYPFLSLTNIEGCLCEFRKYWNIKHGRGRRKYFHPMSH